MKKIIIAVIFIVLIVLVKVFELDTIFTFENLQNSQEKLASFVEQNYILTVVSFIAIYIFSVALLIPIATVLTLAGGFLFGAVVGTVFVNIGATIGAALAFLFARFILGNKIQEKYATQLEKFNKGFEENKYQYLFSLRFLPVLPFFLVNFFCGVAKVDIKTFIITTSLGIIPGSFVYTFAGSKLATIKSLEDIFTTDILLAFVLLGALTLMPVIVKKLKVALAK